MSTHEYFDDWRKETWVCRNCDWTGTEKEASVEIFSELMELNCPQCDGRLAVISFPTTQQISKAAEEGNTEALSMLPQVTATEEFAKSQRTSRRRLSRLPKIKDENLEFTLDLEASGDWMNPGWLLLKCNGEEIYRERSGFEHWEAVIKIGQAIHKQFAGRITFYDPGQAAVALLGDNMSASGQIKDFLNSTHIAPPRGPWGSRTEGK